VASLRQGVFPDVFFAYSKNGTIALRRSGAGEIQIARARPDGAMTTIL
jgi:hypothetical protein